MSDGTLTDTLHRFMSAANGLIQSVSELEILEKHHNDLNYPDLRVYRRIMKPYADEVEKLGGPRRDADVSRAIFDKHEQAKGCGAGVIGAGFELAEGMEAAGHDSTPVMQFVTSVRGGGYGHAEEWAELEPILLTLAIRIEQAPDADAVDSPSESSPPAAHPKVIAAGILARALSNGDESHTARSVAAASGMSKTTLCKMNEWKAYAMFKKNPDPGYRASLQAKARESMPDRHSE